MNKQITELRKLAKVKGWKVTEHQHGQYRIHGDLTVDWWPDAKRKTVWINSTKRKFHSKKAQRVIDLATSDKPEPKKQRKAPRKRMAERYPKQAVSTNQTQAEIGAAFLKARELRHKQQQSR